MFGGWGNGSGSPSTEGSLTRSALYEANNNQDIFRNFGELAGEISSFEREATASWGNIRYDMLNGFVTSGSKSQKTDMHSSSQIAASSAILIA